MRRLPETSNRKPARVLTPPIKKLYKSKILNFAFCILNFYRNKINNQECE